MLGIDSARPGHAVGDRVHDLQCGLAWAVTLGDVDRCADNGDLRDPPLPMRLAALRPTGTIGTPDACASRAVPDLPRIGSKSSEIVPSGNTVTHSPFRSASTAADSAPEESAVPR